MNKSTYLLLQELRDYAGKRNHLPGFEAISRLIDSFERGQLTEKDLPVTRLFNSIERLEQNKISNYDLVVDILWTLESYGGAIRRGEITQKIAQELSQLEEKTQELLEQTPNASIIDFKEIPPANLGEGDQDTFELFARDFLLILGYSIEEGPSRGPDGGKDLISVEHFAGALTDTRKRWVVSCKHFAHSGKAVGTNDEQNIIDRVKSFKADGFMALYSTLPSSTLNNTFKRLTDEISVKVLDGADIARLLATDERLKSVLARYFKHSYKKKLEQEIEFHFKKKSILLEYEKKSKQEEAALTRDAIVFMNVEREFERKLELAKDQRDLELAYLEEN